MMANFMFMLAALAFCFVGNSPLAAQPQTDPSGLLDMLTNQLKQIETLTKSIQNQDNTLKNLIVNSLAQKDTMESQDELIKKLSNILVAFDGRLRDLEFGPFSEKFATADGLRFYWSYDKFGTIRHAQSACAQIGGKLVEMSKDKLFQVLSKKMLDDHVGDEGYFTGVYADKDENLVYWSNGLPAASDWGVTAQSGYCLPFFPKEIDVRHTTSCDPNAGGMSYRALCSVPEDTVL